MLLSDIKPHFFVSLIQSTFDSKLLKDKKSLNMNQFIPFSTFIFLFSFVLDLTYVNSLFIVIFAKVCLYLGLTSMIQQITNELIRTTRISYRFQGTNSGFKSYFSIKKLKSMVGIDPIVPFIQKIKAQFDKNSILTNEVPKGYLLVGQPGTGKTLLAKVIAGETEAKLFPIVASEFFLAGSGIGTIRLREFFQEAKQNSPSIIFIDEIDSIGGVRSGSMGNIKSSQFILESPSQLGLWKQNPSSFKCATHSRSHKVKSNPIITNEFLIQMDGFSQRNSVILIGATNFVHSLDKALLRPGRFDCIIKLNPPDKFLQINVFSLYLQNFDKLYIPPKSQIILKLSESVAYNMSDLARVASESSLKILRDQTPLKMVETLDHALMRTFFLP
jgi:cell division protease FtsH